MTAVTREFDTKDDEKTAVQKTIEGIMGRNMVPSKCLVDKLQTMNIEKNILEAFKKYLNPTD
jgi:hypothetical protein